MEGTRLLGQGQLLGSVTFQIMSHCVSNKTGGLLSSSPFCHSLPPLPALSTPTATSVLYNVHFLYAVASVVSLVFSLSVYTIQCARKQLLQSWKHFTTTAFMELTKITKKPNVVVLLYLQPVCEQILSTITGKLVPPLISADLRTGNWTRHLPVQMDTLATTIISRPVRSKTGGAAVM